MDKNIGYVYCNICKRYFIDVFYEPHKKVHGYMMLNPVSVFESH